MAAYSDDGAHTFSTPVQIGDADRQRVVAPALALGPNHSVHVLYYDLQDDSRDYQGLEGPTFDGRWSLVATRSTDSGGHFDRGVAVDDGLVPPERVMLVYTMPPPSLAVDPGGRVFAAWYDARNGDWDVFLRRSLDGGKTWDSPRRLISAWVQRPRCCDVGGDRGIILCRRNRQRRSDREAQRDPGSPTAFVAVALGVAACSDSGAALPAVPPAVTVTMSEYRFDHGPIPRGRVVLHVVNHGHVVHRMSVVPLPEDLPPIDEQLHGSERRALSTLAAVPDTRSGGAGTVAVDLASGRYAFVCFITDSDGQSHALKGMASEFRVRLTCRAKR